MASFSDAGRLRLRKKLAAQKSPHPRDAGGGWGIETTRISEVNRVALCGEGRLVDHLGHRWVGVDGSVTAKKLLLG